MDPDGVRVGRKLGGGYVQNPGQVIGVVLASSAAVAYGALAGRRWWTSVGILKAIVIKWIMMVQGEGTQGENSPLAVASKLRLRNGSFRLPTWRRPIF